MENYVLGFFMITGIISCVLGFFIGAIRLVGGVFEELEWRFNGFVAGIGAIITGSAFVSLFLLILFALGVE